MARTRALFLACLAWPLWAEALPLERFEESLELSCAHDTICSKTLRSKFSLGGTTGVVVTGGNEGEALLSIQPNEGRMLKLLADGEALHSLALSWDGDAYPERLSGAGLGCFDLTASGATAVVVRDFAAEFECVDADNTIDCPPLQVDVRIYDADDATGQRFSAAAVRFDSPRSTDELSIPFSEFSREGPRGLARLTCVGAITMAFRFEGLKDVDLALGPIFTNGADGLTSVPTPTPTHTPGVTVSATPTPEPTVPAAPTKGVFVTPSATEVQAPPFGTAAPRPEPDLTPVPEEVGPVIPKLVVPRLRKAPKLPTPSPASEDDVVYGAVIPGGE